MAVSSKPKTAHGARQRRQMAPLRATRERQPVAPRRRIPWQSLALAVSVVLGSLMLVLIFMSRGQMAAHLNPGVTTVVLESEQQFVRGDEIRGLLADFTGRGFFSLDVREVQRQLESHPWIAAAGVKRVWPDRLVISLTEETPIARWGGEQLLNQHGAIFMLGRGGSLPALPLLSGPPDSQLEMMKQYQLVSQMLFPHGLRITRLTLSNRGSWELELSDGVRVVIGRDEVLNRLKRFVDIYDSALKNDIAVIETVDLRYENGLSVKRRAQDSSEVAAR